MIFLCAGQNLNLSGTKGHNASWRHQVNKHCMAHALPQSVFLFFWNPHAIKHVTTVKKPFLKNAKDVELFLLRRNSNDRRSGNNTSLGGLTRIGVGIGQIPHASAESRWLSKKDTFCPYNHEVICFEIGSPVTSKTGWWTLEGRRKSGDILPWQVGNYLSW